MKGCQIAEKLQHGYESVYRVIRQLKAGKTAIEIYLEYMKKYKYGLPKEMDFNWVTPEYISGVSYRGYNIPRKSLNYQTPIK